MATETLILLGITIWLAALSIALIAFGRFFRRLVKGASGEDLKKVLERILEREVKNAEGVSELRKEVSLLFEQGVGHFQKMGLIRFNPFKETGGDHSFSLALLDGKDTGIIITGLHTRERTRVYVKAVKEGKSEFELSEEEKKALVKALKG
jgi:hypothetical protein